MMRSRIRTACAYRRILVSGWNAEDALEVREGLAGLQNESTVLDEKLYLQVFNLPASNAPRRAAGAC
jgi:hypothetical protein